ncbi:Multidrug resistance protein MdtA [Grimontia celer]|uniref:Multidrug resistance protein MdtA n=1 Tax=Grimontia celer TaxID=1796497 RepID=A0A128F3M1_9GAMM|nr:secretion protein HlyD [Grimontia celer]CZF80871.1 Multidrug resistance protein MdtA [Grimontia celer]
MNNKLALFLPLLVLASTTSDALAGVKKKTSETEIPAGFQLKTVESLTVRQQQRHKVYQSSCMIAPQHIYHIAPKVEGEVIYVRKGGHQVKKGELLLEIENESVRYAYQVAKNNLRLAALNLKRYRSLSVKQSRQEMDQLQLEVDNLRAEVDYQTALFESFKFYAPEDGVFETPSVKMHDRVVPGVSVLTFYSNSSFEFTSRIPLHIFSSLALENEISLQSVDDRRQMAMANYSHFEPEDNGEFVKLYGNVSHTYEGDDNVKAMSNRSLFQRCTASLPFYQSEQGIFLENKYVHLDYKGFYVFKLKGRRVNKAYVQVHWYDDGILEVESGLSAGDRIATAGSFKLLDNELVRIKPQPNTDNNDTQQLVGMVR